MERKRQEAPADGGGERPPPAKRLHGLEKRQLKHAAFAVLFTVHVIQMRMNSIDGLAVQKHVDRTCQKYLGPIFSMLESCQQKIEAVHDGLKEMACLRRNHHADQLEANQQQKAAAQLRFLSELDTPIYTEMNVTAEGGADIKIGIYKGHNKITDNATLSNVKVEILVLQGDFSDDGRDSWTEEEFNKHIVRSRNRQGSVLKSNCTTRLRNGEASFGQVCFKETSSRTPDRRFILAARVCKGESNGVRVLEAIMKPFFVLDRRNESIEKSHPPYLDDEVWRLEEISKGGVSCNRLEKVGISVVAGFLKAYNEDPDKLREVLQIKNHYKAWEKMVSHARKCCLKNRPKPKPYRNEEENVMDSTSTIPKSTDINVDAGQVPGIPGVRNVENGIINHSNQPLSANTNNNPSFSIPRHNSTHDYPGTQPVVQQQMPTASAADLQHVPPGPRNPSYSTTQEGSLEVAENFPDLLSVVSSFSPRSSTPYVTDYGSNELDDMVQAFLQSNGPWEASTSTQNNLPPHQLSSFHGSTSALGRDMPQPSSSEQQDGPQGWQASNNLQY